MKNKAELELIEHIPHALQHTMTMGIPGSSLHECTYSFAVQVKTKMKTNTKMDQAKMKSNQES